ncbi:hypothetical protein [Wenyingzhuangia sp. 2_MG-2023]|uniref:hypothetical protein n=1 Tax=Wenyingzhuangia sp. 2_MG-2023 TaxID=3062639 RepID=UPI0026E364F0|nr:hypothetical protein [Wenyingzhuangia sp. 2_MG-2023]MDO6737788.1 hypothetical protein [Wenyingzhuangia sp. 2_MG-2023]
MIKELLKQIDAKLLRRFGYYFGGLALGVVALSYINKQKGTTFAYFPNARTLKQIQLKDTLKIDALAQKTMDQFHLDSLDIQYVLHKGNVDFSKSHPRVTPCPDYWIDITIGKKTNDQVLSQKFAFIIERCEYVATIKEIKPLP